jgi:predicted DNA-binding protein (UPF0251 family)
LFIIKKIYYICRKILAVSPRPRHIRTVFDPPRFKGYKPFGYQAGKGEQVSLLVEEYTAIRLCDYELMTQSQAARVMNISRPTFTRLYESARRKIAQALAEIRPIGVEPGHAGFYHNWFHCRSCNIFFNQPGEEFISGECPLCGSENIEAIAGTAPRVLKNNK